MDCVVSARAGSVVVCGGHEVQWMATWGPMDVVSAHGHGVQWWSVHTWGPMDGVVSARAGSVVVCGGHGIPMVIQSVHANAGSVW